MGVSLQEARPKSGSPSGSMGVHFLRVDNSISLVA
jgi:hypothetical protein